MTDLALRYERVTQQIAAAVQSSDRAQDSVQLLAVSKTFEAAQVEAIFHKDQRAFGENYVQEATAKIEQLAHLKPQIEWHLIGPLQSNKTAVVAQHFDWVQTIDRFKIAERLNAQRPAHLPPLNVCIQVNVDGGSSKSGIDCTDVQFQNSAGLQATLALARQIQGLSSLVLRGLLAIPEPEEDAGKQQDVFARVKVVFDYLNANLSSSHQLDTLSMGMSSDYVAAIAAGSTMVRVGSAIFGERQKLP